MILNYFPNTSIYKKEISINNYLKNKTSGIPNLEIVLEELLILWLSNINPAYKPYRELFNDNNLKKKSSYIEIIEELNKFFKKSPIFKQFNQNLIDTLKSPIINSLSR